MAEALRERTIEIGKATVPALEAGDWGEAYWFLADVLALNRILCEFFGPADELLAA